nr:hypothetical protein [Bacteroidota bacterium]
MIKKTRSKLFALALSLIFLSGGAFSQKVSNAKGTIGKEKGEDMIVVCVFGTKACMPLAIDESMKTDLNGEMVSLIDLPAGLYIEVELEETVEGKSRIKKIKTDIDKTVICFTEMDEKEEVRLNTLLENTNGIRNYKFYDASLQVYIEYNHELINYEHLEKAIVDAGFKVE